MTAMIQKLIAWYKYINEDLAGKCFKLVFYIKILNLLYIFGIIYCIKNIIKYYKREQIICDVSKL